MAATLTIAQQRGTEQAEAIRALKAALQWTVDVIDNEVKPPESCGGCGTPAAQCGGECVDAVHFAQHMQQARKLAGP